MTKDQAILLSATKMAASLMTDDNLKDQDPQEAVNQFCKYLDTAVPAIQKRAEYYAKQYGLDLTTTGGDGEGSVLGNLANAAPGFIDLIPEVIKIISSLKK